MSIVTVSPDATPACLALVAELEADGWVNYGDVDEFGTCHERRNDDSFVVSVFPGGNVEIYQRYKRTTRHLFGTSTLAEVLAEITDMKAADD